MNKTRFALLVAFSSLATTSTLSAQSNDVDFMRSTGKIYVVVAVILAIFIGIVLFLIYLDRKLTKLENQIKAND
jgi:CcmD family protein